MRVLAVVVVLLMSGSIGFVNSPGPAPEPAEATPQDLQQYIGVVDAMRHRWEALDAPCDPDAVFALLYLVTTAKVGDLVAAHHFQDNGFLVDWDEDFATRYFRAYDSYHHPDEAVRSSTASPWRQAFAHADSGTSTVTQDLLLGMNAHVNYDLAFSAYAMGLPQDGKKAEFDRVNDAFWNVVVPMGDEMGARYDENGGRTSQDLGPADYVIVELLISWRENAWQNAVLLAGAKDPLTFQAVSAKIQAEADAVATGIIASGEGQSTTQARQAYCHASGHPPLAPALGGQGYGGEWVESPDVWICHHPGTPQQKTMKVKEHSAQGHDNHGDSRGPC